MKEQWAVEKRSIGIFFSRMMSRDYVLLDIRILVGLDVINTFYEILELIKQKIREYCDTVTNFMCVPVPGQIAST